jgi:hypothetical protein
LVHTCDDVDILEQFRRDTEDWRGSIHGNMWSTEDLQYVFRKGKGGVDSS